MSKVGVSRNPGYRSGSHWATCDRSGFQMRAEELKETWDGLWVRDEDYETRHPQDFLRVKKEKIAADQPLRNEDLTNVITIGFKSDNAVVGCAISGSTIVGLEKLADYQIPIGTFNNAI